MEKSEETEMRTVCPKCNANLEFSPEQELVEAQCGNCSHIFLLPSTADNERWNRIKIGRPIALLDWLANLLSIPDKLLLLSWRVDNHEVPEEVVNHVKRFIRDNNLTDVNVMLNCYDPVGEIERFIENKRVSWFSKLFVVFCLQYYIEYISYILCPGRLWGGDYYDPFTNTVHIFSGHVGIALHELGHAKDYAEQRYPGLWALMYMIPILCLVQEYRATKYAIKHLETLTDKHALKDAYRILYPCYATYAFGFIVDMFPIIPVIAKWGTIIFLLLFLFTDVAIFGVLFAVCGITFLVVQNVVLVILGHIIGRIKARSVKE